MIMFHFLVTLLVGTAWCREPSKLKSLPAISHSLVNFGKMDVTFNFQSKYPEAGTSDAGYTQSNTFSFPKSDKLDLDPCPCSNFKYSKPLTSSSDLINKIFASNEMFPHPKDAFSSVVCCDSHEHVLEDTVYLEYQPKHHQNAVEPSHNTPQGSPLPMIPLIYDSLMSNRPSLASLAAKPKAIEIFFFPKKKDMNPFDLPKLFSKKKDLNKKIDIQIVGDKEIRNDFKTYKFRPSLDVTPIKKDVKLDAVDKTTSETNAVSEASSTATATTYK